MKAEDLTGKRFGKLVVVSRAPDKDCSTENRNRKRAMWNCVCDCGKETVKSGDNLRNGHTNSCGCIRYKHLMSRTRLYSIWRGIIERCTNKNHVFFHRYGGRGITVCDEWSTDFVPFMQWSYENGYSEGLTIDRIDNDGDYSPDNCRWVTMKVQRNNASTNKNLTFNGKTMNVTQWADELEVSRQALYSRLKKGWSVEETLSIPVTRENSRKSFRRNEYD